MIFQSRPFNVSPIPQPQRRVNYRQRICSYEIFCETPLVYLNINCKIVCVINFGELTFCINMDTMGVVYRGNAT
jgi:hypothetical protein